MDITLRSSITASGAARSRAADVDGAVLEQARADKERKYPELVGAGRSHLVVVAIDTGGRWSPEAYACVQQLAYARAREATRRLQRAAALGWCRRWTRLLSVACARAFASSLTRPAEACTPTFDGPPPPLAQVLERDFGAFA